MLRDVSPPQDELALTPPRVLIVDDDPGVRELLSVLLQRRGLTIDTAPDGHVAIEFIRQQRYDAILLDLLMPHVDGYAVVDYMKENGRTDPVIVISAVIDHLAAPLDAGIVRVSIQKPLVIEDLNIVISAIVQQTGGTLTKVRST